MRRARRGASGIANLCFSMVCAMVLCARAPAKSCSHCRESRATHNQTKVKAAQSAMGRTSAASRHYKGRDALKDNLDPGRLGRCMSCRGGVKSEGSEPSSLARAPTL